MEQYVVLIQNSFDERIPTVYGPYNYKQAEKILEDIYNSVLHEKEELNDPIYHGSVIKPEFENDKLISFTITWSDKSTSDYSIWCLEKWGESNDD